MGRVTRKRRKRNAIDNEDEGGMGKNEANYTNKYKKLILPSNPCAAKSSHDKDRKNLTHMGHEQNFASSILLRDNVFRPPYDYTDFGINEDGIYSGQQRSLSTPLAWEKNVDFMRGRAEKLSPRFVSTWSSKRVAYFISSIPGISHSHDTINNGIVNEPGW